MKITAQLAASKLGSFQLSSILGLISNSCFSEELLVLELTAVVYTIFKEAEAGSKTGETTLKTDELAWRKSCNENVKKVTINVVTIYELARLVYDKILSKIRQGVVKRNFLESIWLARNRFPRPLS